MKESSSILSPTGEVIFAPHPGAQTEFFEYSGRYALTGGSAGGGKSQCLLFYPFRQIFSESKRIEAGQITASMGHAIYFRRTMPEVQEMIDRSRLLFLKVDPGAEWREQPKTWTFSNGYKYKFGQMEEAKDWIKHYGAQYSCVLFDELTTFTEEQYDMLDTRLRSPDPVLANMLWMRAGTNPVGVGLKWVKKRFVDAGPPNKEIVNRVSVTVKSPAGAISTKTVERRQIFIPARLSDNPSIDQAEYAATLSTKSEAVRRALLEGEWGSVTGDLIGPAWDRDIHVCKPFKVPTTRHLFRSCHFSYAATTVQWYAVDYEGNLTCYRDLFLANHTAKMVAERIREMEEDAGEWNVDKDRGSKITGVLGPALAWSKEKQRGPSPAETMRRVGLSFRRAEENLHSAVDQVRDRLIMRSKHPTEKDEWGKPLMTIPGVRFFKTCTSSLESVPSMVADKNDPDLPDPKIESSAYRALCYSAMSRPLTPERSKPRDDDWESWEKPKAARKSRTGYPGLW